MGVVKKFPSRGKNFLETEPNLKQTKKKWKWKSPLRTILIAFIIGNIVLFAIGQQIQYRQLQGEIEQLEAAKQILLEEKIMLEEKHHTMSQEEMIEKIAREQLGLIKPGERVLILK